MESVKTFVKQYAILNEDHSITLSDGNVKTFLKGEDFLLGGKYGYQYDSKTRNLIIKLEENLNYLIPEKLLSFEEETEVVSIFRNRKVTSPP